MSGESSWRFAIVGDTLTASNKRMVYTLQIGIAYPPILNTDARIGPRRITQFLDEGCRLYTQAADTGAGRSAKTVARVASFVSTYAVPRVSVIAPAESAPAAIDTRLDSLLALVRKLDGDQVRILDTRLDLLVLVQQVAADQARLATEMQRIASELGVK